MGRTGLGRGSPFHDGDRGQANVLRTQFADWDNLSPWRKHLFPGTSSQQPTLEQAREIVNYLLRLHGDYRRYALLAHCHYGLFRSGAVVEWLVYDLGIGLRDHELSRRIVDIIDDGKPVSDSRPYNWLLLHLLRRAAAEQGLSVATCNQCRRRAMSVRWESNESALLPHVHREKCAHRSGFLDPNGPSEYREFFKHRKD